MNLVKLKGNDIYEHRIVPRANRLDNQTRDFGRRVKWKWTSGTVVGCLRCPVMGCPQP